MNDFEIPSLNGNIPPLTNEDLEAGYVLFDESKFSHWKGLLDQWIENIKKFCRETDGKVNPYNQREECNVGLLASAAWMANWIALSETPIKRGWLDIWMKLPGYEKIELVEAKFTNHIKLNKRNGNPDKTDYMNLKKTLEDTERVKQINPNQEERIVVIIYLAININDKNIPSSIVGTDARINHILHHNFIQDEWDLTAWCFPDEMRNDPHPGIIMSAKVID